MTLVWGTPTANDGDKFATYFGRADTGLDYAVNRYYDSARGRFLTPDPYPVSASVQNPQSWNRYGYVENDRVNFKDPYGLFVCSAGDPENSPFCPSSGSMSDAGFGADPSYAAEGRLPELLLKVALVTAEVLPGQPGFLSNLGADNHDYGNISIPPVVFSFQFRVAHSHRRHRWPSFGTASIDVSKGLVIETGITMRISAIQGLLSITGGGAQNVSVKDLGELNTLRGTLALSGNAFLYQIRRHLCQ
jgi:RHS repeat-associated protein